MSAIEARVQLQVYTCATCGILFALEERWVQMRSERDNGVARGWHCPAGHVNVYRKNDLDRAKEQLALEHLLLERTRAARDRAQDLASKRERQLSAQKGVTTRIKNRIARGVCPCCNRSFENLHRHMQTKHPDYAEAEA